MDTTIGARLRLAREQRVMSQADLADASGVQEATISRLENGRVDRPRFVTVRKLAEVLGVDAAWLLHGEEATIPKLAAAA